MELFNPLSENNNTELFERYSSGHAVIITFNYDIDRLEPIHELGAKLRTILCDENIGEYDGHELAMDDSHGSLYMYGPNAERLFKAVKTTLEATDFLKGATANLRFGPIGKDTPEIDVTI